MTFSRGISGVKTMRTIAWLLLAVSVLALTACGGLKRDRIAEEKAEAFLNRFKYFPDLTELVWERADYETLEAALGAHLFTVTFAQTEKEKDNFYLCVFPTPELKQAAVDAFSDDLQSLTYAKGRKSKTLSLPATMPRALFQDPEDASLLLLYDGRDMDFLKQLDVAGYTTLRAAVGEPYHQEYRAVMLDSAERLAILFDPSGGYETFYLPDYGHPMFFLNGETSSDPRSSDTVLKTETMLAVDEGTEMTLFFQRDTGADGWPRQLAHPLTASIGGPNKNAAEALPVLLEKLAVALHEAEQEEAFPGAGRIRPGVKYRSAQASDLATKLRAVETYTLYLSNVHAPEYLAELMIFPSEGEARQAVDGINSEFTQTGPPNIEGKLKWSNGARLYQHGRHVVLYTSDDENTLRALERVLGAPERSR